MSHRRGIENRCGAFLFALVLLVGGCGDKQGEASLVPAPALAKAEVATPAEAAARGAAWLRGAAEKGLFAFDPSKGPDVGMTALALAAVQSVAAPENRAFAAPGLAWLRTMQKPDGAIYEKQLAVYCTAAALLAFTASGDVAYADAIVKGREYLRMAQSDEGEGLSQSSEDYGGIGYGGAGDINMSTTQLAVDAAKAAGLPKDDAYYKKALVFLQRSQNRSESNDQSHTLKDGSTVVPGNDGGGIYRPGDSKAGVQVLPDGRRIFRSYGSMTYALLKSYLLCEMDAKDPRITAALQWIAKNWQLEWNPGMEYREKPEQKYEGLFYYYLTLARALGAAEKAKLDLAAVGLGQWRKELAAKLMKMQASDGSWTNAQDRWWEGSPVLCTSYALMALAECRAGS